MLKAVESDNPMISITLLNTSKPERKKPFPYVSRDLVGRMAHSKYDILAMGQPQVRSRGCNQTTTEML